MKTNLCPYFNTSSTEMPLPVSNLVNGVIRPALKDADHSFSAAPCRISVENLTRAAENEILSSFPRYRSRSGLFRRDSRRG